MMNHNLYVEYRERFGCRISIAFQTSQLTLSTSDRKLYAIDEATDDELDAFMRGSLESGKNLLLEKFKDKEYSLEINPALDY